MTYRKYLVMDRPATQILQREHGDYLVIVQTVGGGFCSSWGYAIWQADRLIAGDKFWEWDRDMAIEAADRALLSLIKEAP